MARSPDSINVARWVPRSRVNGPGERFVLWVQGCGLACPGCWNPDTWSFATRVRMSAGELCERIMNTSGIEGITLTGGEPFAQARALSAVARQVRDAGLSVMIFTGHELAELRSQAARDLLALTDILVSGRFVQSQRDISLTWRGSANQQLHFLSARYSPSVLETVAANVELHIADDGSVHTTGFPADELVLALRELRACQR